MACVLEALGDGPGPYSPLTQIPLSRLRQAQNVVLLVIDGLGYEFLTRAGAETALHAHLVGRITSVFPSTTATAITTLLTGTAPQQHGLTGWFTYFEEIGTVTAVLPFKARHGGGSLGTSGVRASTLFQTTPLFNRLHVRSYVVVPQRIAGSDYNVAHAGIAERRPYGSLNQLFGVLQRTLREGDHRKYVYAYWPELDGLAHTHGIGSKVAAAHLAQIDGAFRSFLESCKGSRTVVLVTADHGIVDSPPERLIELESHPDLAATLLLPLCGEARTAYCYVHPGKREEFEAYVRTHLAECTTLFRSEDLVEQGYFGLGPPHPRLLERIGHYTLSMRDNYRIKDWVPGERRYTHIGTHGGLTEGEMYVPLVVVEL